MNSFFDDRPEIRTERKLNHLDYVKHINTVKKENQDLKTNLKLLNKSLDKILKSNNISKPGRYSSPINESEEDLEKKIESTEFLISKYKKEINLLKESHKSTDMTEKIMISKEIKLLKYQVQELETENKKLSKNSPRSVREDNNLKKELMILKERYGELKNLIKEDEKIINEFKIKVSEAPKSKKTQKPAVQEDAMEGDAEGLKLRILELENQKKQEESVWKTRINEVKQAIEEKEVEVAELESTLKEKDKNCRIKKMNIKATQRESRVSQNKAQTNHSMERVS